jgi:hypothetical protein
MVEDEMLLDNGGRVSTKRLNDVRFVFDHRDRDDPHT